MIQDLEIYIVRVSSSFTSNSKSLKGKQTIIDQQNAVLLSNLSRTFCKGTRNND